MPRDRLHMTVLEVTHSRTEAEIQELVSIMKDGISKIADFTVDHHAQLSKPMLSYDAAAIALSFVPAAGEDTILVSAVETNAYTYHHLRRDIYAMSKKTGVTIASRYTVPSSHLTIARFVTQRDITKCQGQKIDTKMVADIVSGLEKINADLELKYWRKGAGKWVVGEERGLDCRRGTLWYGGGETEHLGKGFSLDEAPKIVE